MRRQFLRMTGAATIGILGSPFVRAATASWPSRPIRIVIPSAPGSPWDPVVRLIAERVTTNLKQTCIVDNKSGATGMLGMDQVAKADDGHTFGVIFMPHVLIPALFKSVPYDITRDVVPVTQINWTYNVLVVHPSVNASSVTELVELAKRTSPPMTYASGGNGTPAHVTGEYFRQLTGTTLVHVPYRGPVAALQDLIGGQAQLMFASVAAAIPHIASGRIRALAVTSQDRLEALPSIPTFVESGFPRFDVRDWGGIVASTSVPAVGRQAMLDEIMPVLNDPAQQKRFRETGIYLQGEGPQALASLIRSEKQKWADVIAHADIRME